MEWENARGGRNALKATALEVGQEVVGTVRAIEPSTKYENKSTLLLELVSGEQVTFFPSGTLNYDIADDVFEIGRTYKITRQPNYTNKRGVSVSKFDVQVAKDIAANGVGKAAKTQAARALPKI